MIESFNKLFKLHKDEYNLKCYITLVAHGKTSIKIIKLGNEMPIIDLKCENIYALYLQAYIELEKYINNTTLS